MGPRETLLAFRRPPREIGDVESVRSTIIAASIQSLRRGDAYDAYVKALDPSVVDTCVHAIAGVWLPIEVATKHYQAIDALHLPERDASRMGEEVSKQVQAILLGTVAKLARTAGVTPWTALAQMQRLWDRGFIGGDIAVFKSGPKDAHVETIGVTLVQIPYFRTAFRAYLLAMCQLFSGTCIVKEAPRSYSPRTISFHVAWA